MIVLITRMEENLTWKTNWLRKSIFLLLFSLNNISNLAAGLGKAWIIKSRCNLRELVLRELHRLLRVGDKTPR